MPIDLSPLPADIKSKVEELSKDIDFSSLNDKGGSGYVLIGYNRILKREVVVKFYYWGGGDHAEPALLAQLESDHILKVYHAESINKDDAFFVTPFCAAGDLDDALESRKFGTVETIDVMSQLTSGVSFLHGSGYLHRDLKPANIFCLSDARFVIGDFGSVVIQNSEGYANTKTRHSLIYRPPEEISQKIFCRQSDIYQLGIDLYQILGGYLPYEERAWLTHKQHQTYDILSGWGRSEYATKIIEKRILRGNILDFATLPPWTPKSLKTVIRTCCATNRAKRFGSVADLSAHLNNLRSRIPDWRIEEHPVLRKNAKMYRLVPYKERFAIEKKVTTVWRQEKSLAPSSLVEAVQMAEGL